MEAARGVPGRPFPKGRGARSLTRLFTTVTQQLFEFSFAGGVEALNSAATKGKKKKIRGKGKNAQDHAEAANAPPASSSSARAPPTFYYESTRIMPHCRGNVLLQGLVAPMPGVLNIGSRVEIIDIGDLSAFNVLSLKEPDDTYEDEIKEMYAEDLDGEDKMEVDDSFCIFDGVALNLWVKKVESGF